MKTKSLASLTNNCLAKDVHYFFRSPPPKPWFSRLALPREQIVAIGRLRSNHYNLNYSLNRKNIVASSACSCEDPRQDFNYIVFRCPLINNKSLKLRTYLFHCQDIFPSLRSLPPALSFAVL